MNNRKIMSSVFEKISNGKEVNLESQKVELTGMDDLKSQMKECRSTTSKLLSIRSAYFKEQKSLKSFGEILQSQGKRLRELALDLKKQLDKLGIETPKQVNFYIEEANDFEATGKDAVKQTR